jgi:hypothetical protein
MSFIYVVSLCTFHNIVLWLNDVVNHMQVSMFTIFSLSHTSVFVFTGLQLF